MPLLGLKQPRQKWALFQMSFQPCACQCTVSLLIQKYGVLVSGKENLFSSFMMEKMFVCSKSNNYRLLLKS